MTLVPDDPSKTAAPPTPSENSVVDANAIHPESHGSDTLRQPGYDAPRTLRHTTRVRDASNIIEYIREASWLEVHYLWRAWQGLGEPGNSAITNRADIA